MTKRCGNCGRRKPREKFHRQTSSPDGLQFRCKDCGSQRDRTGRSEVELATARARSRALNELRRRHQEEFAEIFAAERARGSA